MVSVINLAIPLKNKKDINHNKIVHFQRQIVINPHPLLGPISA